MKKKLIIIIVLINVIIGYFAFNLKPAEVNFDAKEEDVQLKVPANFPKPVYDVKGNKLTPAGFKLGRILFYDRQLSLDQSISCGSCHQSKAAFANFARPLSRGIKGCTGARNAPALFNLAWQREFMWDGRLDQLDLTSHNALTNPCEMANDMNQIIARLQDLPMYPPLFRKAFGDPTITPKNMMRGLAQFMAAMVSANSRYDKHIRNDPGGTFSKEEELGYAVFKLKCSSCHREPLFTDHSFRNNGLEIWSADKGRDSLTHRKGDIGKFKIPSLRNVEVSAPYMHDGHLETLEQVLAHYAHGVKANPNLDPELKKNGRLGILLNSREQQQIIVFLRTLTDKDFISDKRFQNP
ncbi:cytochrome-c peroxidase [Mucilaginibacter sp. SMC90]|uniref:cytochrome-c peroxidase n=1 Tax=Mucilaginibacter sp. SMC90 TaxID=2929803 RepID=UPI001FB31703|nr:cytochrome c peroxidase [Mucilaginibacter sp. SMC90]UOE52525.1 cytochrome-c peroxidase [Mucilaginibacter sp. SMC90]